LEEEIKGRSRLTVASIGKRFSPMEVEASDPTQANISQVLKLLFQGKV
jgi:hypothetical protein